MKSEWKIVVFLYIKFGKIIIEITNKCISLHRAECEYFSIYLLLQFGPLLGKSGEASLLGAIAELKKKFSSLKVPRGSRKAGVLVFKINQNEDFSLWDVTRCDTILRDSVYIDVKIEDFEEIEGASLRLEGPVRARALAALESDSKLFGGLTSPCGAADERLH